MPFPDSRQLRLLFVLCLVGAMGSLFGPVFLYNGAGLNPTEPSIVYFLLPFLIALGMEFLPNPTKRTRILQIAIASAVSLVSYAVLTIIAIWASGTFNVVLLSWGGLLHFAFLVGALEATIFRVKLARTSTAMS